MTHRVYNSVLYVFEWVRAFRNAHPSTGKVNHIKRPLEEDILWQKNRPSLFLSPAASSPALARASPPPRWAGCSKRRGLKVAAQKLDPYINVDPGTMSPYQHGEVFVTEDGAETDLDLGHYERFIDENLNKYSNLTTGKVYWNVLNKERRGEYLGQTVQVIPHITNEIKSYIYNRGIIDRGRCGHYRDRRHHRRYREPAVPGGHPPGRPGSRAGTTAATSM